MPITIQIPSVERDTRIGSVFSKLFTVVKRTEACSPYDDVIWDFSDSIFFHPFYICGLSLYKNRCERNIIIRGLRDYTKNYLNAIFFDRHRVLSCPEDATQLMSMYWTKSYIPICKFDNSEKTMDFITSGLQNIIQRQCQITDKLVTPISYLIAELVTNIHDHSNSDYGYIFSQYLQRERCLNICIADDGLSVYGSFAKNRLLENMEDNSQGAILDAALHHTSSKNLPNAENRGYGLPTSKDMLVNGMNGEFFMLSGGAFHRHNRNEEVSVTLPAEINWQGTIVLLKIPLQISADFDYINYI